MTTTIATTTIGLPKNKTGLFAADTLQEVKPAKNPPVTVPTLSSHHRHVGSSNTSEHTRSSKHGSSYHSDRNNGIMNNETYLSINGIRDGFRPSLVRRQKFRIATAMARHDNNDQNLKDSSLKRTFPPSPASARLRSEIDQINSRLKIHRDLQKLLQSQNNNRVTFLLRYCHHYEKRFLKGFNKYLFFINIDILFLQNFILGHK
jgi:hypothetical protein